MYDKEQFLQKVEDTKLVFQNAWCHVLQKQVPLYQKFLNDVFFLGETFKISYLETTDNLPVFFIETNRFTWSYPYNLFKYDFMRKTFLPQECISKAYYCTHFFIGA